MCTKILGNPSKKILENIPAVWDEDLFFGLQRKFGKKIPLSLVFNGFDIATANFLATQAATDVERLLKGATGHQRLGTIGLNKTCFNNTSEISMFTLLNIVWAYFLQM